MAPAAVVDDAGGAAAVWTLFAVLAGTVACFAVARKVRKVAATPGELFALVRFLAVKRAKQDAPEGSTPDERFCYAKLVEVSRSFAGVIMELPDGLREAVLIFYLVLRGLDSVEDDMEIPVAEKARELRAFHEHLLDADWCETRGWGEKPVEKDLLARFSHVTRVFEGLEEDEYRRVIRDITRRMGEGMAEFAESGKCPETLADYDRYCHYVAGLVGIGLSGLFAASGLEDPWFGTEDAVPLANRMGLFLQKTNITRDYLEDALQEPEPRVFYPRELWSRFTDDILSLKDAPSSPASLGTLNAMVTNALREGPASLEYMSRLRHERVFAFCAVPQMMAIATLEAVYDNPAVFRGAVKIRKGQAVAFFDCLTFSACAAAFARIARAIEGRVRDGDPSAQDTRAACRAIVRAASTMKGRR